MGRLKWMMEQLTVRELESINLLKVWEGVVSEIF